MTASPASPKSSIKRSLWNNLSHSNWALQSRVRGSLQAGGLGPPILLSFAGIMARLYSFVHLNGLDDRVDFIFDTLGSESKNFTQYEQFIGLAPPHLKDVIGAAPDFQRDDEVPALQAADMIAWHARRYQYELKENARPEDFESPLFTRLLNTEHILDIWTEERIVRAAGAAEPDLRRPLMNPHN